MSKKKKHEPKTYLANASISPVSIHTYYTPLQGFDYSHRFRANMANLSDNSTEGQVSKKAARNIDKAVSWLLFIAKPKRVYCEELQKSFTFKINFITLTLPAKQQHTDQEIKARCLNNFIQVLRKKVSLRNYLWRAEAQANGNIHFHLVTDKFIHYSKIQQWWNQSVELLGYVSEFESLHGHRNPNSTDVHSVKHVKRLASYLSKYFCKNRAFACIGELREEKGKQFEILYGSREYKAESADKKQGKVIGHVLGGLIRPIQGKLWYCSSSLSKIKPIKIDQTCYEWASLEEVLRDTSLKVYEGKFVRSFYGDIPTALDKVDYRLGNLLHQVKEEVSARAERG